MTSDTNKLEKVIYNNIELFISYFNIKERIEGFYFGRTGILAEYELGYIKISSSKFFTWLELINNAKI